MRDSYFNCYFKEKNEVKVFNSISTSIIKLDLEHYEKLINNVDMIIYSKLVNIMICINMRQNRPLT